MDPAKTTVMILGLISVCMFLLIFQQVSKWQSLRQQIDHEQAALEQDRSQMYNLKDLATKAADLQEQLQQAEIALPTKPKEDILVKELQRQAYSSGMKLLQVKFSQYQTNKQYTEMPFTLSLEGQYSGLQYFLNELQQGPRKVVVNELKISKDEGSPVMRVDVKASAFYVPAK